MSRSRADKERSSPTGEARPRVVHERLGGWRIIHKEAFSAAAALEAVSRHRAAIASGAPEALKSSRESCVSLVEARGRTVCVKQFGTRGLLHGLKDYVRPSPARRSWRAASLLRERGIGAPAAYALVRPPLASVLGDSFVIMERLADAQPLHTFTEHLFRVCRLEERKRFVAAFARFVKGLHGSDVYHKDLKVSNVFVQKRDNGFAFLLVDLASVHRVGHVSASRRLRNLAQLHASLGKWVTSGDRLRFLRECLAGDARLADERDVLRDLARRTAKRRVIWEQ